MGHNSSVCSLSHHSMDPSLPSPGEHTVVGHEGVTSAWLPALHPVQYTLAMQAVLQVSYSTKGC